MSDMVEPVHADSFFSVSRTGEFHERLNFEYLDMSGYYRKVIRDEKLLAKEVEKLVGNMQFFLDRERVEINSERVKSRVDHCDIFLKGDTDVVSVKSSRLKQLWNLISMMISSASGRWMAMTWEVMRK